MLGRNNKEINKYFLEGDEKAEEGGKLIPFRLFSLLVPFPSWAISPRSASPTLVTRTSRPRPSPSIPPLPPRSRARHH
jgi:hypothetical protein